jgi:hypothetical protein
LIVAINPAQTVYPVLADLVVWVHLGFVVFVVLGGLLVMKWHLDPSAGGLLGRRYRTLRLDLPSDAV